MSDVVSIGYGTNSATVSIGEVDFYFSYRTVIACRSPSTGLVVCENVWSTTTGKHLNEIDGGDKRGRAKAGDFQSKLAAMLAAYGLTAPTVREG